MTIPDKRGRAPNWLRKGRNGEKYQDEEDADDGDEGARTYH